MKKVFLFTFLLVLFVGFNSYDANASTCPEPAASSISASSDDVEEFLQEYEEYVDEYVKVARKAKNGDSSALTEMTKLAAKAAKLVNKIDNVADDMTEEQLAKYAEITAKMSRAAY